MKEQALDRVKQRLTRPLASVIPGTKCRFVGIRRGFSHKHKRKRKHHRFRDSFDHGKKRGFGVLSRLLDLGLTKGCVFEVVQASSRGPVLIEIRGTRIALGHGLASKILIEEVPLDK